MCEKQHPTIIEVAGAYIYFGTFHDLIPFGISEYLLLVTFDSSVAQGMEEFDFKHNGRMLDRNGSSSGQSFGQW